MSDSSTEPQFWECCGEPCQVLYRTWYFYAHPAVLYENKESPELRPVYANCRCQREEEAIAAAKKAFAVAEEAKLARDIRYNDAIFAIRAHRNRRLWWLTNYGRYLKSKQPVELYHEISAQLKEKRPMPGPLAKLPSYIIEAVRSVE